MALSLSPLWITPYGGYGRRWRRGGRGGWYYSWNKISGKTQNSECWLWDSDDEPEEEEQPENQPAEQEPEQEPTENAQKPIHDFVDRVMMNHGLIGHPNPDEHPSSKGIVPLDTMKSADEAVASPALAEERTGFVNSDSAFEKTKVALNKAVNEGKDFHDVIETNFSAANKEGKLAVQHMQMEITGKRLGAEYIISVKLTPYDNGKLVPKLSATTSLVKISVVNNEQVAEVMANSDKHLMSQSVPVSAIQHTVYTLQQML